MQAHKKVLLVSFTPVVLGLTKARSGLSLLSANKVSRQWRVSSGEGQKMIDSGKTKKERRNPNDPARFIGTMAVTQDGEAAGIHKFLDEEKIESEAQSDGLYAVCTDLLDDDVSGILKVSEGERYKLYG